MTDEKPIDTWGRLEVEWRNTVEAALERQRQLDGHMTNHLVYHLAGPDLEELKEIASMWRVAQQKREAADAFIREYAGRDAAGTASSEA